MTRQRKAKRRPHTSKGVTAKVAKVTKDTSKPVAPSFSITYTDYDDSVKISVQEIRSYQTGVSYRENFEDEVSTILDDGGAFIDDKYVIPLHRILRFDIIEYKAPVVPKKATAKKSTTKKAPVKKAPAEIKEGKVCKGGLNGPPTTPPPPPPHGQGVPN
jgi:hypothetical protein